MGEQTYVDYYNQCVYAREHGNEAVVNICGAYPLNSTRLSEVVRTTLLGCEHQVTFLQASQNSCYVAAAELYGLDLLQSPLGILSLGYLCSQGVRLFFRALFSSNTMCQTITKGVVGATIIGATAFVGGLRTAAVTTVFLGIYEIKSAMNGKTAPRPPAQECHASQAQGPSLLRQGCKDPSAPAEDSDT